MSTLWTGNVGNWTIPTQNTSCWGGSPSTGDSFQTPAGCNVIQSAAFGFPTGGYGINGNWTINTGVSNGQPLTIAGGNFTSNGTLLGTGITITGGNATINGSFHGITHSGGNLTFGFGAAVVANYSQTSTGGVVNVNGAKFWHWQTVNTGVCQPKGSYTFAGNVAVTFGGNGTGVSMIYTDDGNGDGLGSITGPNFIIGNVTSGFSWTNTTSPAATITTAAGTVNGIQVTIQAGNITVGGSSSGGKSSVFSPRILRAMQ